MDNYPFGATSFAQRGNILPKKLDHENASPSVSWAPEQEKTPLATWLIGLVGVLLFIVGIFVQQYAEGPDGYVELLKGCLIGNQIAAQCENSITTFHEASHSFAGKNIFLALAETLKGLSVALLVSLLVSNFFERANRNRLNKELSDKAQQISNNVFDALFGNSHPPAVLDTIKSILNRPITRERLDVTYTLTRWDPPAGRLEGRKYIRVEASLSALTRNIADPVRSPGSSYLLPVALSLPNPQFDELKPLVKVTSFKVDGVDKTAEELTEANSQLQLALKNDNEADANVEFGSYLLNPGNDVRVQADYVMMKEIEDTEVLRSFQLTQALTLTVIDKTGLGLTVRARAIHPGELAPTGNSQSFLRWELNDIILPQQGIMVWWKEGLAARRAIGHTP